VLIAVLVDQRLPLGVVDFEHTSEDRQRLLVALNAALQRIGLAVIALPNEGRA
jgi:hypothetical protein